MMAQQPPPGRMTSHRFYLDVPFSEKDQAKTLGARWDPAAKRWYDPRPPSPGLDRWAARPEVPDLLPGEDRTFGEGLFVDLVPRSCWFTNVRSCVTAQDWERLRRMITRRADQRCEICGAGQDRATSQYLEAHERWTYDTARRVQSLRRLICVCSACHLTTHMGYANVTGRADQARAHLRAVTGMTPAALARHIDEASATWITRSALTWTLDLEHAHRRWHRRRSPRAGRRPPRRRSPRPSSGGRRRRSPRSAQCSPTVPGQACCATSGHRPTPAARKSGSTGTRGAGRASRLATPPPGLTAHLTQAVTRTEGLPGRASCLSNGPGPGCTPRRPGMVDQPRTATAILGTLVHTDGHVVPVGRP